MKRNLWILCSSFFVFVCLFSYKPFANACEVSVYTYDSMTGHGSLGDFVFPLFEAKTGCHVHILAAGDSNSTLGRLELESHQGQDLGDVFWGIDLLMWDRLKPFVNEQISLSKTFQNTLISPKDLPKGFVPFDYAPLAFITDLNLQSLSLDDLLQNPWHKKFILEDPRTSSLGLQFLLLTQNAKQQKTQDYWKELKSHWLTMPPSWESAYPLFLAHKAHWVWSESTSQAYHDKHKEFDRHAVFLQEGTPLQVEGAAILKNSHHPKEAQMFIDFLLSLDVQKQIPETNWMYPIDSSTPLPESFRKLPFPKHPTLWKSSFEEQKKLLIEWKKAIY